MAADGGFRPGYRPMPGTAGDNRGCRFRKPGVATGCLQTPGYEKSPLEGGDFTTFHEPEHSAACCYWSFSTWLKPSSTGVSRPKMDTSTVSFCVVGSTSETTAAIVVNGPSVTVT